MNNHRKNNSYRIKNIILNYIKDKNIFNSTYNIFYRVNTGGDIRR